MRRRAHLMKLGPWPDPCWLGWCTEGSGVGSGTHLSSSAAISSKIVLRSALPCPKRCTQEHADGQQAWPPDRMIMASM